MPSSFVELQQVIETIVIPVTKQNVWIGFSDEAVEGTFVIAAGPNAGVDASEIISWGNNEPNGDRQENCVVSSPNFKWAVDAGCAFTAFYVIEYECPFGKRFNNQGTACIGTFLVFPFLSSGINDIIALQTSALSATTCSRAEVGCKSGTQAHLTGTDQLTDCVDGMCMATQGCHSTRSSTKTCCNHSLSFSLSSVRVCLDCDTLSLRGCTQTS